MILETWQIKSLEHQLLDYEAWINHVETCGLFANPQKIIDNKISVCFKRMVGEYESINETIDENLTNEEKVNTITGKKDYKNRNEMQEKK